ncbi:DUF7674 family protein [Paenibacillus sp. KN14-4R]|uniref:DUF7674 family protein n=1 Tax=Paenibacillus sp. KN14-4R TaxID=3445773 RepID=UPI003F9F6728
MMIEKEMVMDILVEACPSYKLRYEKYIKETYEPGEEILIYVDISDFIDHIIDLKRNEKTKELVIIFNVVELLHIIGNEFVKEFATIGFLESLLHELTNQGIEQNTFESYLKPVTKTWWNNLIDFWNGKTKYVGGPLKKQ